MNCMHRAICRSIRLSRLRPPPPWRTDGLLVTYVQTDSPTTTTRPPSSTPVSAVTPGPNRLECWGELKPCRRLIISLRKRSIARPPAGPSTAAGPITRGTSAPILSHDSEPLQDPLQAPIQDW